MMFTQTLSTNDINFTQLIQAQKRGQPKGITSICSSNPLVIEAALRFATPGEPVLLESTCNQVNQYGGYTGMTPADFRQYVAKIAEKVGFPTAHLIFGGDHLGPHPWQKETAVAAMSKAATLIRDYVAAGYSKIHLDASMKCSDDDKKRPLPKETAANRAAALAAAAEETWQQLGLTPPRYVIGTEVPIPGGAQAAENHIAITTPDDVAETILLSQQAFQARGLETAWERVIAVVVQPGVEFGDDSLFAYDRAATAPLVQFIENNEQLIYEAHSTDYQTTEALRQLVMDHFAILKVGPALTFALREAIFALAAIEGELLAGASEPKLSRIRDVLEQVMLANPEYWQPYYTGSVSVQRLARRYSFSDRLRYYWPRPEVSTALTQLLDNLSRQPIPLTLLSQFMPVQYGRVTRSSLSRQPHDLILDKINDVLKQYNQATSAFRSLA